jgi:hypothetical protein
MSLKHIRADQELSSLLRIGLEWFQLQSGIAQPILECPSLNVSYLEVGWFRSLRYFLCSINAKIHLEIGHIPKLLREHDSSIMETFILLEKYTQKELYRLNLCRMYLQVECLSEMCNPTGDGLLPEIWQGRRCHDSKSAIIWPNQARPYEKSWNNWRSALKLAYLSPEIQRATKARTLLPLNITLAASSWISTRHRFQRTWDNYRYVSKDSETLYCSRHVGYRSHPRIPGTFQSRRFQLDYSSAL